MPPPRLSRSLKVLRDQVDARWPHRNKASDGWIGDAAHAARKSDHNPDPDGTVDALDITHDPSSGCDVGKIAEAIRESRDRRVSYMIFNARICSSTNRPWAWRRYTGRNPHSTHLHISILDQYQDDPSPWQIGGGDEASLFERKAPGIMRLIMAPPDAWGVQPLDVSALDAAAMTGNAGHESDGFKAHFQYNGGPARGLWQWEGSRRDAFESKCREWSDDPDYIFSHDANVRFLLYELTQTWERRVIPAMRDQATLRDKTIVFCDLFERPGVKAHDARVQYAERALSAYETSERPAPVPLPPAPPRPPAPPDDSISDGVVSPDSLLQGVRPERVVVRDILHSEIEGFPEGVIETTYIRGASRFIAKGSGSPGSNKETDMQNATMAIPTLPGKKTYLVAALYAAAMFTENALGIDVPGFAPDPEWLDKVLVYSGFGVTFRAAIQKIISGFLGK